MWVQWSINWSCPERSLSTAKKEEREQDYVKWLNNVKVPPPMLNVSYDMGWQQCRSGQKYDSASGHGIMIGVNTKKIIGFWLKCKVCQICSMAETKKVTTPTHICTKNHHRSSKSMEVDAIYNLIVNLWDHKQVGICCIVSDDDTTMHVHLKHSWRDKIMAKKMREDECPRTAKGRKKTTMVAYLYVFLSQNSLQTLSHRKSLLGKICMHWQPYQRQEVLSIRQLLRSYNIHMRLCYMISANWTQFKPRVMWASEARYLNFRICKKLVLNPQEDEQMHIQLLLHCAFFGE